MIKFLLSLIQHRDQDRQAKPVPLLIATRKHSNFYLLIIMILLHVINFTNDFTMKHLVYKMLGILQCKQELSRA